MWVTVIVQDNEWTNIWSFPAEDNKSFTSMSKKHGIEIMTSCGAWACGICKCKVVKWNEFVQIDKMWNPLWELSKDENWNISTIFTCIGWVKSEYLNDNEDHEVILRRNI